jgi:hypothetical protein
MTEDVPFLVVSHLAQNTMLLAGCSFGSYDTNFDPSGFDDVPGDLDSDYPANNFGLAYDSNWKPEGRSLMRAGERVY